MVNIHEAKTKLSKLLATVARGKEVVIANAGRPVAKLVPFTGERRPIGPPGAMAGEIWQAGDFSAPLDGLFDDLAGGMQ